MFGNKWKLKIYGFGCRMRAYTYGSRAALKRYGKMVMCIGDRYEVERSRNNRAISVGRMHTFDGSVNAEQDNKFKRERSKS